MIQHGACDVTRRLTNFVLASPYPRRHPQPACQRPLTVNDVTYSSDDLASTPVQWSLDRPDSLDVPTSDVIQRSPLPSMRRQLTRQLSINPRSSQDSLVGKVTHPRSSQDSLVGKVANTANRMT